MTTSGPSEGIVQDIDEDPTQRHQRCVPMTDDKTASRVLVIGDMDLDEELDTGGEIGEVSQSITDRAVGDWSAEVETVPLPSGKRGWKAACHMRLPVGFLPSEWRGKRVRVIFEVEEERTAAP